MKKALWWRHRRPGHDHGIGGAFVIIRHRGSGVRRCRWTQNPVNGGLISMGIKFLGTSSRTDLLVALPGGSQVSSSEYPGLRILSTLEVPIHGFDSQSMGTKPDIKRTKTPRVIPRPVRERNRRNRYPEGTFISSPASSVGKPERHGYLPGPCNAPRSWSDQVVERAPLDAKNFSSQ